MAISHQGNGTERDSDACSVPRRFESGLLQLTPGRSSPEHHPPLHLIQNAIPSSSPTSLFQTFWLSQATCIRFKTPLLACKAKNRHLPPWRHSSNCAPRCTPFKCRAWLKSTHRPSRQKEAMHQDSSRYWHPGDGMSFPWISEQLSLAVLNPRLKAKLWTLYRFCCCMNLMYHRNRVLASWYSWT